MEKNLFLTGIIIVTILGGIIVGIMYMNNENNKKDSIENTSVSKEIVQTKDETSMINDLTEEVYNDLDENEYFIVQEIKENDDQTFTIKGRIYEDVKFESISQDEYDKLKKDGKINLFNDEYIVDKDSDADNSVGEYAVKNSMGYGFYISSDKEMVDFNDTNFVKGTDKYYSVTVEKTVKVKSPDGSEIGMRKDVLETSDDYDYINIGDVYSFVFKDGNSMYSK